MIKFKCEKCGLLSIYVFIAHLVSIMACNYAGFAKV